MSMIPPSGAFASLKPTKYQDIAPGSVIDVEDVKGSVDPFRGQVLEYRAEHGPNSLPTLIVLPEGLNDPVIVSESGKWRVTVRVPAIKSSDAAPPPNLAHVRRKPTEQTAIRFMGGVQSALEIIKWAAGFAVVRYVEAAPGEAAEHLVIPTLEGAHDASIGDWVVKGTAGEFYPVKPDIFVEIYDIIQAPPRVGMTAAEIAELGGSTPDTAPPPFGGFFAAPAQ